jgi:hypothetical protein
MIIAAVVLVAACVGGYFVYTSKHAQVETPEALDAVAAMLTEVARDHGEVKGKLDGRPAVYTNYVSRQTTYSDLRVQVTGAPSFEGVDGLALDADLTSRIAKADLFKITCDGTELRVQANRILRTADEARAVVGIGRDLANKIARK